MPLCSCKAECNCAISTVDPDNGLLLIIGDGNPELGGWKLQVIETPWDGTGDGAIVVTENGPYGHGPTFALQTQDTGTVALQVDANGLRADALSVGSAGGGTPTGVVEDYLGNVAPSGYVMASGVNYAGYIPITDAPGLYGLVGHSASGGVDPGNGTFLVPYLGEKFLLGSGGAFLPEAVGGEINTPLTMANIPAHDHPAVLAGSADVGGAVAATTTVDAVGNHQHAGAGAGHFFLVENSAPASYEYVHIDAQNVDTAGTMRFTSNGVEGGNSRKPNREGNTAAAGGHGHTAGTTVDISGLTVDTSGLSVDVQNAGTGAAPTHNNMPPYYVVNRIIKT